jgi:hypothetical protein
VKDIYDVLMVLEDGQPLTCPVNLASVLRGEPSVCRVFMRHYHVDDVPEDEEGSKQWLMDRYVEKDALFDRFLEHGEFISAEERAEQGIVAKAMERSWSCLLNTIFWFGVVHSYVGALLWRSLARGGYVLPGIFVALIFIGPLNSST